MAKRPIVSEGDPVLRKTADAVPPALFGTPELAAIIRDMADTLDGEADGVAIAAPQIGVPYRIFLARYDRMRPESEDGSAPRADLGVFINPSLVKTAKKKMVVDEGCLSVRNVYGKTERQSRATVRAYAVDGAAFERGAGGILAQAFQHEIDHLNGILFTDHATDIIHIKEEEREAYRAERRARRAATGHYDDA